MFYSIPSIARPLVKFVLFGLLFGILPVLPGEAGILEQMEKELVELADRVRPAVVSLSPYIATVKPSPDERMGGKVAN